MLQENTFFNNHKIAIGSKVEEHFDSRKTFCFPIWILSDPVRRFQLLFLLPGAQKIYT